MKIKITKKGTRTIKTLILLLIATIISSQVLPKEALLFIYPALLLALIFLLPVFHQYRKTPDFSFFGNLCIAAILFLLILIIQPYVEMAGFVGYSFIAFSFVFLAMVTERVMGTDLDATLMTIIFITLANLTPLLNLPILWIWAFLATAVILDLSRSGFHPWVRGMFAGLVWSTVLFGFSNLNYYEISTAAVYSIVAGLVAGSLFGLFHLDDEKHIEKVLKKI